MKKIITVFVAAVAVVAGFASPAGAVFDWGTWSSVPVKFQPYPTLTPGDTTVPFALDTAFKPITPMSGMTASVIDVEWNFFLGSFAAGYGSCTTNATPDAYQCPGGITVQVTRPDGDPYTVDSVELVDRTDWTVWNTSPFDVDIARAATLVVRLTSPTPVVFLDALIEAHFPADSINLPSEADQDLLSDIRYEGAAMYINAAAYTTNRQGFTQGTGGGVDYGSGNSGGDDSLPDTGSAPADMILLAVLLGVAGFCLRHLVPRGSTTERI